MARYLITGIAGFIGSALARELLLQGHEVAGIDNLSTGRLENLAGYIDAIDFYEGDIRDRALLDHTCCGVDVVFHQAAMASVPRSIEFPLETHDCNVNGTLSVLIACRNQGVRRVVYAASSSAYGDQPHPLKHEDLTPRPLSPYAVQKLAGEHYMQSFHVVYGLETVCLRYFNIFGPRQAADSPYSGVIARFIHQMLQGETPTIFGDGLQSRDFTFVANAVHANVLAASAPAARVAGGVFNIGTGEAHTLRDLHSALATILDRTEEPHCQPARSGDVQHSQASILAAKERLGYQPRVSFFDGLMKTVDWYRSDSNSEIVSGVTRAAASASNS